MYVKLLSKFFILKDKIYLIKYKKFNFFHCTTIHLSFFIIIFKYNIQYIEFLSLSLFFYTYIYDNSIRQYKPRNIKIIYF